MAKAKKTSSTAKASDEKASEAAALESAENTVDAPEIADTAETGEVIEPSGVDAPTDAPETPVADTTPEESTTTEAAFAEAADETAPETAEDVRDEGDDRRAEPGEEVSSDAAAEPEREVHPVPVPVAVERRGSAFWPMLLGGALAAGLGFLAAQLDLFGERDPALDVARLTTQVNDQSERLATLEQATPVAPDMAPLEEIRSQLDDISAAVEGFGARLTALEERPVSSPDTGLDDAYARELAALQSSVEQQRAEIESLLQNALSVEEATAQAAQTSAAQTALAQIIAAIESGQPYAEAITTLQANDAVDVPEALAAHADTGVATLAVLQAEFPDRSRAALAAARANDPEEAEGGFGGFLRRQLGARSVAPRDGTDADAVLSRAEAAMREGRLGDALAEAETLSAAASAALEEWLANARARHDVQTAAADLAQRLTAN